MVLLFLFGVVVVVVCLFFVSQMFRKYILRAKVRRICTKSSLVLFLLMLPSGRKKLYRSVRGSIPPPGEAQQHIRAPLADKSRDGRAGGLGEPIASSKQYVLNNNYVNLIVSLIVFMEEGLYIEIVIVIDSRN
jgi:hypothetical protein